MTEPTMTTWSEALAEEKKQPYFQSILNFLAQEKKLGKTIYPPNPEIFSAFQSTPFEKVKVVIIGQDPYHGPSQAHGLSFSVKPGIKPPPSLHNIFLELKNDLGLPMPQQGCLTKWAEQGVLLLNTSLSVERSKPQSHAKIGWHRFTDKVICQLNLHPNPIVFLLWGAHAQSKRALIDEKKHKILMTSHPSPFSAHQGFLGCKHFSQANDFLKSVGRETIDWNVNEEGTPSRSREELRV